MTLDEEREQLREAGRDLGYQVFRALGMIALVRRLGMTPKPWIREREKRDPAMKVRTFAEHSTAPRVYLSRSAGSCTVACAG